jgi:hypothetical protein
VCLYGFQVSLLLGQQGVQQLLAQPPGHTGL